MRVRRKKRTKRLIVLLSLLLLGIVGFRNILPNLGDVFQYHHVASGEYGWNLILVNRDNYIPDDYTVELTELSNGQKVDSRIYPSLQEMFDAARAEGLGLFVADGYRTAETQQQILEGKIGLLLCALFPDFSALSDKPSVPYHGLCGLYGFLYRLCQNSFSSFPCFGGSSLVWYFFGSTVRMACVASLPVRSLSR